MLFLVPEDWLRIGRQVAEVAVSQLWQGAAVAAGLAVCLRLAPRTRASHRFALWLAAFALVALLPLAPWLAGWFFAPAGSVAQGSIPVTHSAWFRLDERWGVAVLAVWAVLAAVRLAMLAAGAVRARKIWTSARPLEGEGNLLSEPLPGRARVEICQTSLLERPSVIGFLHPRILVPDWLAGKLSAGELRQIVLHEQEHLRRMDDWTNLGLKLATALLPLNPALLWMERRLDREREMATDEAVVRLTRAPRAYAACLASVAERRLEMRLGMGRQAALELGAWRRRPELAERILSLLRTKETVGPVGRTTLAGTLALAMMAAAVLLVHAPQLVAFAPAVRAAQPVGSGPVYAAVETPRAVLSRPKIAVQRHLAQQAAEPAAEVALSEEPANLEGVVPVLAELHSAGAEAESGGWVVLAVFEQRVSVTPKPGVETDFAPDDAAAVRQKAAPVARHRAKAAVQRQLIWQLLPVAPGREGWVAMAL
jgi:beta-lactamase regulating signal transducer with metallopeptidase domain